jgi:hypothetical protein
MDWTDWLAQQLYCERPKARQGRCKVSIRQRVGARA